MLRFWDTGDWYNEIENDKIKVKMGQWTLEIIELANEVSNKTWS